MAARPKMDAAGARLSVEAAHYYARIYGAARSGCLAELRRLGCRGEEAEDVFATTLERIMRKFDPTRSTYAPAQMVALLRKACREKLIDERRHCDVIEMVPLRQVRGKVDESAEDPAEAAVEREAVAIGREAISSLPERDRAVFYQRHQLGLDPQEILRRNPGPTARTYRKLIGRANARALAAFEQIGSGERCEQMKEAHLRRYVAEEASGGELATVEAHLRHCRSCRREAARLRGHLHDVASGLAAALATGLSHPDRLAEWPARLLDVAGSGGQALAEATRAARERLRELALRAATSLPGSGGESAAGQLAGLSGAKAASICAAGAITAGCLAAGVVPGVGALDLAAHQRHRGLPKTEISRESSSPQPAASAVNPAGVGTQESTTGDAHKNTASRKASTSRPSEASTRSLTRPTSSASQTAAEFGVESAGSSVPAPVASTGSSGGAGQSKGADVSSSRSANSTTGSGSAVEEEFGF